MSRPQPPNFDNFTSPRPRTYYCPTLKLYFIPGIESKFESFLLQQFQLMICYCFQLALRSQLRVYCRDCRWAEGRGQEGQRWVEMVSFLLRVNNCWSFYSVLGQQFTFVQAQDGSLSQLLLKDYSYSTDLNSLHSRASWLLPVRHLAMKSAATGYFVSCSIVDGRYSYTLLDERRLYYSYCSIHWFYTKYQILLFLLSGSDQKTFIQCDQLVHEPIIFLLWSVIVVSDICLNLSLEAVLDQIYFYLDNTVMLLSLAFLLKLKQFPEIVVWFVVEIELSLKDLPLQTMVFLEFQETASRF